MTEIRLFGFDEPRSSSSQFLLELVGQLGYKVTKSANLALIREDEVSIYRALKDLPARAIRILFAGELHGANFDMFDYVIGWELENLGSRYVRFHPALRESKMLSVPNRQPESLPMEKRHFCNFIYSNPLADPFRDQLFHKLSAVRKVDSLGPHLRNCESPGRGQLGEWEQEKIILQSKYRLSFAIENGCYPGYTTEKVFSAKRAGSVPIYWGNPDIGLDLNEECLVNLHNFDSVDAAVRHVLEIDEDLDYLRGVAAKPMFNAQHLSDIEESRANLKRMFESASLTAKQGGLMRPSGTSSNQRTQKYFEYLGWKYRRETPRRLLDQAYSKIKATLANASS